MTVKILDTWILALLWVGCFDLLPDRLLVANAEQEIPKDPTVDESCGGDSNDNTQESCRAESLTPDDEKVIMDLSSQECGIWLALSTLEGTGIGMFAGKNFSKGERLMQAGDHLVAIVDLEAHHGSPVRFLWSEYTWSAPAMYMEHFGVAEVNTASAGFGAAANSFMDFVNADEQYPKYTIPYGLHRSKDPGAGAFTYYHSRHTNANIDVQEGQELFVSYGNNWFLQRKHKLGAIPVKGDHAAADRVYRKFRSKFLDQPQSPLTTEQQYGEESDDDESTLQPQPTAIKLNEEVANEMWDTFVLNSAWEDSPTMAALPPKEDYEAMYEQTLTGLKKSRMIRSSEWLEQNGVCADNMQFGESTIRQAGHGAFASRKLRKESNILPIPLIHIPDREVLNMYHLIPLPGRGPSADKHAPRPPQLLLNYCLGHRDSTVLLSPYGPVFNLINHNQTQVNVRLQWASPERSQHDPGMLQKNVSVLEDHYRAKLAMELVALRDIEPGEEIFLDYGDEWEEAWQRHVQEWKPVEGAAEYTSAFDMNQRYDHLYRTEFEQMHNPYPSNLMLKFHSHFTDEKRRKGWIKKYPVASPESSVLFNSAGSVDCEILGQKQLDRRTVYTIVIPKDKKRAEWLRLEEVPREAIFFQDRPYTSDMFLDNAFRHDIRIPDELFPESWKNLKTD